MQIYKKVGHQENNMETINVELNMQQTSHLVLSLSRVVLDKNIDNTTRKVLEQIIDKLLEAQQ